MVEVVENLGSKKPGNSGTDDADIDGDEPWGWVPEPRRLEPGRDRRESLTYANCWNPAGRKMGFKVFELIFHDLDGILLSPLVSDKNFGCFVERYCEVEWFKGSSDNSNLRRIWRRLEIVPVLLSKFV